MNNKSNRVITKQEELKEYLTTEKIEKFNKHIIDYINITNELDKNINKLKKRLNFKETVPDEFYIDLIAKNIK
jgi:RNA processing factor Prp31